MKLLALDTSSEACSAALMIGDEVKEKFELTPKAHTRLILPMIDELMQEAGLRPQQLDAIAFGRGPGSFTGVRIATGVMQGIAFGADLPVLPISTLAALAQGYFLHYSHEYAWVAMDARIQEVFCGAYQRDAEGYAQLIGAEQVLPPALVKFPDKAAAGVGSGWAVYAQALEAGLTHTLLDRDSNLLPRAAAILKLAQRDFIEGKAVPVEQAMPVYLRDKVAQTEQERNSARKL